MAQEVLSIRGARQHNLKNIDLDLPRDRLIVFTGLSGSGKSSLAFDTIFAEGQRRYVESLSAYARQFLGQMDKPDVDQIDGLSPAISIDQKSTSRNPRSTVGTVTEIHDYLRLLFARIGHPHCPNPRCSNFGGEISRQTVEQIVDTVLSYEPGSRIMVMAPVARGRKGEYRQVFDDARRNGFVRARVDGTVYDLGDDIVLEKYKKHDIEIVVDRLRIEGPRGEQQDDRARLADSVETALKMGGGLVIVAIVDGPEQLFSENYACPVCGTSVPEIEPRTFSFNSPHGACPECTGLGTTLEIDPELVIPNPNLSLNEGAIQPWSRSTSTYYQQVVESTAREFGIPLDLPFRELTPEDQQVILYGIGDKRVRIQHRSKSGRTHEFNVHYEGVIPHLMRRYRETDSEMIKQEIEGYMMNRPCPVCHGARLKPESLAVTVAGRSIVDVSRLSIRAAARFFTALAGDAVSESGASSNGHGKNGASIKERGIEALERLHAGDAANADNGALPERLPAREATIARQIIKEIRARLGFLVDVGLDYLTLERSATTLSGGEAQRIRLASQIGSGLVGVLYVLDEPSIGLHQRDNARLIKTLLHLKELGNTLIVVEHDEDTMRAADHIVDIGPGAGEHGGHIVYSGDLRGLIADPASITGQFLAGKRTIPVPRHRRAGTGQYLTIRGARENNLKNIDVSFPLGTLIGVTGVSGSGKSTLISDILYRSVAQHLFRARERAGEHDLIEGLHYLDKVIDINQAPIGRTPRSNPATYTGLFTPLRELFAQVPESRIRGYKAGRFSFNVKGGRCEACQGAGIEQIEMHFLPDVYVPCEVCKGKRYNREALEIHYKGKNISEVLEMTVEEALGFFESIPAIANRLRTLNDVGLGYIHLGQPATTLSGGEAQRIKLAAELSRRATGRTLYILDEPTTGLHFADTARLLQVLQRLVDAGNTVVVIEHNLDVIKSADWIIDLGPEGGAGGGEIVAQGTPEQIADDPHSYTGAFLRRVLPAAAVAY
ncbi:MAG TPA: excinuclease ABC subunit UvrA [Chloroflexota bacterium]|nr:excinuclease ABC subunit UvrA [Chloroflexota bacterium]